VDPSSGAATLINDLTSTNAVKAYRTVGVQLQNLRTIGNNLIFDFPTCVGSTYTVEYKNALTNGSWNAIVPSISGDGAVHSVTNSTSTPEKRFFRVRVN
jgi:hypothetical protein